MNYYFSFDFQKQFKHKKAFVDSSPYKKQAVAPIWPEGCGLPTSALDNHFEEP